MPQQHNTNKLDLAMTYQAHADMTTIYFYEKDPHQGRGPSDPPLGSNHGYTTLPTKTVYRVINRV